MHLAVIADESGLQMPQKEEFQIDIAFAVDEFLQLMSPVYQRNKLGSLVMIDLQECGLNARDAIFNYCEDGKVLLHDFGVTVVDRHTRKTPIEYAGKLFTLERFNEDVL